MAVIVPAVVLAAAGIYSIASGAAKEKKAKDASRSNIRPEFKIAPEDWDNQRIAQSLAGQGLTDTAKQTAMQGYDRGMSVSIDGILKGGGDINSVDKVYDSYLTNVNKLALADDQTRIENITRAMQANARIASGRSTEFQVNQYAPYVDRATAAAQAAAAGSAQVNNGISLVGQSASSYSSGYQHQKDMDRVFAASKTSPTTQAPVQAADISNTLNAASTLGSSFNPRTGQYNTTIPWDKLSSDQRQTISSLYSY